MEYIHNFKINPLLIVNGDWNRPFDKEQYFTKYISEWQTIFNDKFIKVFQDHIKVVMVFNKPTNWNESSKGNSVHVDEGGIICAMNVVLPTTDNLSLMQWFKTDISQEELLIGSNSNYAARWNTNKRWTSDQFKLIHEDYVDNRVTLVRVDIPHKVVISQSARVCISIRLKEKFNDWKIATRYVNELFQEFHHI